jgi:hypothetical protein
MPNTPPPTTIYLPLSVAEHKPEKDGEYICLYRHKEGAAMSPLYGGETFPFPALYKAFLQPCERIIFTPEQLEAYRKEVAKEEAGKAWVSVEEGLPDIEKDVLLYYTIPHKTGVYEYIVVGYIQNITQGATYKSASWVDKEYNAITPTHWQPLPPPPDKQTYIDGEESIIDLVDSILELSMKLKQSLNNGKP